MKQNQQKLIKKVFISADLIFDYNNLLFSSLRSFFEQRDFIIDSGFRKNIEQQNPLIAFDIIHQKMNIQNNQLQQKEEWKIFFKEKLKYIKPQLGSISLLNAIHKSNVDLQLISYLEQEHNQILIDQIQYDQEQNYNILTDFNAEIVQQDLLKQSIQKDNQHCLYISGDLNLLDYIQSKCQESLLVHVLNDNYKEKKELFKESFNKNGIYFYYQINDIDFKDLTENINEINKESYGYLIELNKQNDNLELKYWFNTQLFKEQFVFQSNIIQGFGRGSSQLGMPTANLDIDQKYQEQLKQFSTGIYLGKAQFLKKYENKSLQHIDYDKEYNCVISIGYNPYYDLKQKTFEVYIMEEFSENFYEQLLKVNLIGFIRSEADFKEFNQLIQYIQNDITMAKEQMKQ